MTGALSPLTAVGDVVRGDLTAALAYGTPAGGVVVTAVAPCGIADEERDADDDGQAHYSPHTAKGFTAPPAKTLLLVTNGLLAKRGVRQARKHGVAERLAVAASARPTREGATTAATDASTPAPAEAAAGARR